jgi:hypothetical protein
MELVMGKKWRSVRENEMKEERRRKEEERVRKLEEKLERVVRVCMAA